MITGAERDQLPSHTAALLRHFADLRDRDYAGVRSRADKERAFAASAVLLDPVARTALDEINDTLLLGKGAVSASGVDRTRDGGLGASWTLSWPEQEAARVPPITLQAAYGAGFHHPHLRGGTVRDWPFNVFTAQQAQAELPILRAIAAAELHNLVFMSDYRIVPATVVREA